MPLIVIVDDRVSNRNIFAKIAASIEAEITVRTFGDPVAALAWLEDNVPDLVITDYKMPKIDGAEFSRRFRLLRECEDVPVIVITVYEERSFRLCALEAGATDFLNSPVDHHEFVTRARNLLKLRGHQLLLASRAHTLEQELELSERSRQTVLRDSREQLAQVIDTVPAMIRATGKNGELLFVNAYQAAFDGMNAQAIIGSHTGLVYGSDRSARDIALNNIVFDTGKALPPFEEDIVDVNGVTRVFLTSKSPLKSADDTIQCVLTSSLDITSRKRMEAHLRHQAHHDALTDLPNRVLLHSRMRNLIARARRGDKLFAVHTIDFDGFKTINDLFGHAAGDRFIKTIAHRLQSAMRENDTVARLGGDEFVVLQADVTSTQDAAEFGQRLLSIIEAGTGIEDMPVPVTASIGIAIHPGDGADVEELLKNSDLAMYRAKAERGNHFCFYASDMMSRSRQLAVLDKGLQRAFENGEFVLHYQPQIDLRTGTPIGVEALLRWNDPEHGLVAPNLFLPHAEENGLIIPINEWVLKKACEDCCEWQRAGIGPVSMSVNMSPVQFRRRTVPLHVASILAATGMDPKLLDIELTEGIVMNSIQGVIADMRELVKLGVSLSIDDFGTGYSSLSYIKHLPVNRIKIDQSFIKNVTQDPSDAAIVRAIITLAHSLDLKVLAEGVETPEQYAWLRSEGCNQVQGFYLGKAVASEDILVQGLRATVLARSA